MFLSSLILKHLYFSALFLSSDAAFTVQNRAIESWCTALHASAQGVADGFIHPGIDYRASAAYYRNNRCYVLTRRKNEIFFATRKDVWDAAAAGCQAQAYGHMAHVYSWELLNWLIDTFSLSENTYVGLKWFSDGWYFTGNDGNIKLGLKHWYDQVPINPSVWQGTFGSKVKIVGGSNSGMDWGAGGTQFYWLCEYGETSAMIFKPIGTNFKINDTLLLDESIASEQLVCARKCQLHEMCLTYAYQESTKKYTLGPRNNSKPLSLLKTPSIGGEFKPTGCHCTHRTAVIVPFRDRESNLNRFLDLLHRHLQNQNLHYRIFLIHQIDNYPFNRAKLMNIGFKEVERLGHFYCYIFHDVDLLPAITAVPYTCSETGPVHLVSSMDKYNWTLPYKYYFGGVTAISLQQLRQMNGFSNQFWGWGGEDDDVWYRMNYSGLRGFRLKKRYGRYRMIKHKQQEEMDEERFKRLTATRLRWRFDGLNALTYDLVDVIQWRMFTEIQADLCFNSSNYKFMKVKRLSSRLMYQL